MLIAWLVIESCAQYKYKPQNFCIKCKTVRDNIEPGILVQHLRHHFALFMGWWRTVWPDLSKFRHFNQLCRREMVIFEGFFDFWQNLIFTYGQILKNLAI